MSRAMSKKKQDTVTKINQMLEMCDDEQSPVIALGKIIGAEALAEVMEEFGGQKPHIPTLDNFYDSLARDYRNKKMRDLFHPTHYGYDRLAREFSGFMGLGTLSERHVREIIHADQRTYKRKPEQYKPVKLHKNYHHAIALKANVYSVPMATLLQELIDIAMKSEDTQQILDAKFGRQITLDVAS